MTCRLSVEKASVSESVSMAGGGDIIALHVDDEPDLTELVAQFLEPTDDRISVQTEHDTEAAPTRLAEADIDRVVSDYDMPNWDGIELLEAVRD